MTNAYSPYISFDKSSWSSFNDDMKLNITEKDLLTYRSLNDVISLKDVADIYLPLSRLLNLYFKTRATRTNIIEKFIGKYSNKCNAKSPFIIVIAGSVAVGKSTTARLLQALIKDWSCKPSVSLVTTDGFLYSRDELQKRNILDQKGFPISYDIKKLLNFVSDAKCGKSPLYVPKYSHLTYDLVPNEHLLIENPDVLIIEGLNVLQSGIDYPKTPHHVFLSDYVDFSIYVDAQPTLLKQWYRDRFLALRANAFKDPNCFFYKYTQISEDQAMDVADNTWDTINYPNLIENILPTRERANLILTKGQNHAINNVKLRK
jgi:type I pantothenate kinase